jgi:flagellar assembly protein FliH
MASIIKFGRQAQSPAPAGGAAYQFDDMEQSYLDRVRREAAGIVAQARAEAAQIKTQAAAEGKQSALQAVEASLRTRIDQQLQSVVTALNQAVHEIAQSRQAWQRHWETQALHVATAIASRIVQRELRESPETRLNLVREALQLAAGVGQIVVRLSPADHAALAGQAETLTRQLNLIAPAQFVADSAVASGGCQIETEFGTIDNQIETQLARITEELVG